MTEAGGFPEGTGEPDLDAREADEVIDQDVMFGTDADQELDRSYSPPERPLALDDYGTTLSEQRAGESLDQRLAREEPDPAMAVEPVQDLDEDLAEAPPDHRDRADHLSAAGDPDLQADDLTLGDRPFDEASGDLAAPRSGRLVAPDQGLVEDREKDLVASDVGIDGGAAAAEEAAMHVIDADADDADDGDVDDGDAGSAR
jgi:hypothetical protein